MQNVHGINLQECPENCLLSRQDLALGLYSAILQYNLGAEGIIDIMRNILMESCLFFYRGIFEKKTPILLERVLEKTSETG